MPLLEEFNPGDQEDIHAVYLGQGGPLPARVREFITFLSNQIRIDGTVLMRNPDGGWSIALA